MANLQITSFGVLNSFCANALRSGVETAQRFARPAPSGAYCRNLLLMRLSEFETETDAEAPAEAELQTKLTG